MGANFGAMLSEPFSVSGLKAFFAGITHHSSLASYFQPNSPTIYTYKPGQDREDSLGNEMNAFLIWHKPDASF